MAILSTGTVIITPEVVAAATDSLASVARALDVLDPELVSHTALKQFVCDAVEVPEGISSLFRSNSSARLTGGALDKFVVSFDPSERYLELVAAIAVDCENLTVFFSHGWPLLSVGTDSPPTVTEAGGARNLTGGGLTA